jgi:DNA-binding response OmpR family regulator
LLWTTYDIRWAEELSLHHRTVVRTEAMQLLVVEDERRVASFLERGLRAEGYVVSVVHDGEQAVQLALTEPFSLIILDLRLPKMDGLTVLREIRALKLTLT